MSFHEIRFPTDLSFGALGGPERRTEIVTLSNGFEERNSPWAGSRRKYDAGVAMRSLKDIEEVIAFLRPAQGSFMDFVGNIGAILNPRPRTKHPKRKIR